jgi:phospholipid/cholesterol/gamma-HCH transport system ATP-binding protein
VSPGPPDAAELIEASLSFGPKVILDGLTLSVPPGAKLSLLGESSCGKSTILKVLVGLIAPDRGRARLFGRDLALAGAGELRRLRRRVGMQFQAGALFDSLTVGLNLLLAARECSRGRGLKPFAMGDVAERLSAVGLGHAVDLKPSQLSGGMRKRAALARALVASPDLALFDEPTAGLDPVTASLIINLLNSLAEGAHTAMIVATSDVDVARRFSDDLALIHKGRIRARGSWRSLSESQDPYVAQFLGRSLGAAAQ